MMTEMKRQFLIKVKEDLQEAILEHQEVIEACNDLIDRIDWKIGIGTNPQKEEPEDADQAGK